jgi:uncharacterized membrane-anchored protein
VMKDVVTYASLALLIVAWDWKALRRSSRSSRWLVFATLVTSVVIWVWISKNHQAFKPMVWLNKLLEPFDPIQ